MSPPSGLTLPLSVAAVAVTPVAANVVAVGAEGGTLTTVKFRMLPGPSIVLPWFRRVSLPL